MKKAKKNPLREAKAEVTRLTAELAEREKQINARVSAEDTRAENLRYAKTQVDGLSQELNRIAQERSEEIGKDYGVRVHVRTTITMG